MLGNFRGIYSSDGLSFSKESPRKRNTISTFQIWLVLLEIKYHTTSGTYVLLFIVPFSKPLGLTRVKPETELGFLSRITICKSWLLSKSIFEA